MKVRKNYVLYVNEMLGTASFGNNRFGNRISNATIGKIFDCTLSELKHNIKVLSKKGYSILKMNY